jgi:hypothetical protein
MLVMPCCFRWSTQGGLYMLCTFPFVGALMHVASVTQTGGR